MFPLLPSLYMTLGLFGLVQAEPVHKRAVDHAIGKLYGYGSNITSMPLFVANGAAYLGNVSLSSIPDASNVTFRYVAANGEIVANHQHTNISGTTTNSTDNYFSIDISSGASSAVLIEGLSAETDYTTEDFYVYGTQIMWREPDATIPGSMESNFYAVQTDVDFVWKLYWDADGKAGKKGNVVVLKNVSA